MQPAKNVFPTACRCGRTNGSLLVSVATAVDLSRLLILSHLVEEESSGSSGLVLVETVRNAALRDVDSVQKALPVLGLSSTE